MFAGVDPHYATLTLKPYPRVATIAYYVQNPVTGNYGMIKSDNLFVAEKCWDHTLYLPRQWTPAMAQLAIP